MKTPPKKQRLRLRRFAKKLQAIKEWVAGQFRRSRAYRKMEIRKTHNPHKASAMGAYIYKAKQVKLGKGKQTLEGIPQNIKTNLINSL